VPVEIQEFEVIAEVQQQEQGTPAAVAQAAPSPAHIAREVEATLGKLLARHARLRAT
jgi:hypothetical protein